MKNCFRVSRGPPECDSGRLIVSGTDLSVVATKCCPQSCLTFELSGRQRQDARPGMAKMYSVPPDRAWWPAVGAPLERRVRQHWLDAEGA